MQVTRLAILPEGVVAFPATARGMGDNNLMRASRQAYDELLQAVARAGVGTRVTSYISLSPDTPKGPNDPDCRIVAGLVFGYSLATGAGQTEQPVELALSGTLAWQPIAGGRYAVFTHIGPYTNLHLTWKSLFRDWLPASSEQLRGTPPLEFYLNTPATAAPEALHTEIWLPLV